MNSRTLLDLGVCLVADIEINLSGKSGNRQPRPHDENDGCGVAFLQPKRALTIGRRGGRVRWAMSVLAGQNGSAGVGYEFG